MWVRLPALCHLPPFIQLFTASNWLGKQHTVQPLLVCQSSSCDFFLQIIPRLAQETALDAGGRKPSDCELQGGERIAEDEVGSGMGRSPLPGVVMTPGAQRCGRLTVKCPWEGKRSPEGELRPHCSWLRRSQQVVKAHSWKRKKTEENTRST